MKKLAGIALGVMLAMSLVACGDKKEETTAAGTTTVEATTTAGASTEATTAANTKESTTEQKADAATGSTTQAAAQSTTEQAAATEGMMTEEEANRALTNYIHATYGENYGEDLPEGTQCYWYVNPLYGNTYEGQLHAATGSLMYFYIDPYTGKTDVCELTPVSDTPEYVTTVNFKDYLK